MSATRWMCWALGLALCVGAVYWWNRGAQRRRFVHAYPNASQPWREADAAFLEGIGAAFRLPRGAARRLPPETSPMALYLALYPEHCIYDTGECERCLRFLRRRLGPDLPREALAEPLRALADRWLAAPPPTPNAKEGRG